MKLSEVERNWLKWLERYELIYLVRDNYNDVLNAYSHKPKKDDVFWYGSYPYEKSAKNFIDSRLFKFVDAETIFQLCRDSSGELELVALKGENL